jgi:hypothetical protein
MTTKQASAIAAAVVQIVKNALVPRDRRINELEIKCARLETKQQELETKALQSSHKVYLQNTIVTTDDGTRWTSVADTITPPGTSSAWRLVEDGQVQ